MRWDRIRLSLGLLALFGGLAFVVALNDVDFFSLADLFDTTEPHHEHIVAALLLVGVLAATVSWIRERRRIRVD